MKKQGDNERNFEGLLGGFLTSTKNVPTKFSFRINIK